MQNKLNNIIIFCTIFIISIFLNLSVFSQASNFTNEIDNYENLLSSARTKNYITTNELLLLSKKIEIRESFISTINSEIKKIDKTINSIQTSIERINSDLDVAKQQYAKLLVFTYLNKSESTILMYILSANSFNQAYLRFKYLKIIATYTKRQAETIYFYKKELEYQQEILKKEKNIREDFNKSFLLQKKLLTHDIKNQLNSIDNLQQKSDTLRKQLVKYHKWQDEINTSLTNDVTNELDNANAEGLTKKFENNKGLMPMPLFNTIVISSFGEHSHPTLDKIKIKNDGIDITSHSDDKAKAVFEGRVASVVIIPNHNYSVLIKHGDYYTVYSNIINIKIKKNEKVKQGDIIGQVAISDKKSFPVLNFQVWHLTNKKDPIVWVKRN